MECLLYMMDACSQNKRIKKPKTATTTKNNTGHTAQESSRLISINWFLKMTQIYIKPPTCSVNITYQTVSFSKEDNDWWCFGDEGWDCYMSSSSLPLSSTLSLSISSPSGPYSGISKWRLSASKFLHLVHRQSSVQARPSVQQEHWLDLHN